MIILKEIPGLSTADIMGAIGDMVPLAEIKTGFGGVVVDESTALLFLQRYFGAQRQFGGFLESADSSENADVPTDDAAAVTPPPAAGQRRAPARTTRRN